MIQAIRITQYRASDGLVFASRDEAHRHEIKIAIMDVLGKSVGAQLMDEERELIAANLTSKTSPVIVLLKSPKREGM
jgi:hypothetical protein